MRKKIQLTPSGISLVDEAWGGFYNCGTYLLVGSHKSGKTLLGLQVAQEAVNQQAVCIYFTNMRLNDLLINAASINFDLQYYMDHTQVILIHISHPNEKDFENDPDKYLSGYLQDFVAVVEQYQPAIIVFDELTPFVNYNDVNKLQEIYLQTCESLENLGVTSLFVLSEPVSQQSKDIVDMLKNNSTGLIQLNKKECSEGMYYGGNITITPNIGHTEGYFKSDYRILPQKGIAAEFISHKNSSHNLKHIKKKKQTVYKTLSEIETPAVGFPVINFYNEMEFRLLLNNQIAYYKSTAMAFTLCSVFLDEEAESMGLITINQLKNAIRLSVNRKDKITVIRNRIIVLVADEDQKEVNTIIAGIKSNLPVENAEQLSRIIQYISVYTLQIDETVSNADVMLEKLFPDKFQDKII